MVQQSIGVKKSKVNVYILHMRSGTQLERCGQLPQQRLGTIQSPVLLLHYYSIRLPQVHADQLAHVRKGCLACLRQDVASDGSRIEGSHKGWNSIMRSFSSGLEVYTALAHDFVLRRNLRVAASHGFKTGAAGDFAASTNGCHHLSLVDAISQLFNSISRTSQGAAAITLPVLPQVDSDETFGLVSSDHIESFGGLLMMKEEVSDDPFMSVLEARAAEMSPDFENGMVAPHSENVSPCSVGFRHTTDLTWYPAMSCWVF